MHLVQRTARYLIRWRKNVFGWILGHSNAASLRHWSPFRMHFDPCWLFGCPRYSDRLAACPRYVTVDGLSERAKSKLFVDSLLAFYTGSLNFLWLIQLSSHWNDTLPHTSTVVTKSGNKIRITVKFVLCCTLPLEQPSEKDNSIKSNSVITAQKDNKTKVVILRESLYNPCSWRHVVQ